MMLFLQTYISPAIRRNHVSQYISMNLELQCSPVISPRRGAVVEGDSPIEAGAGVRYVTVRSSKLSVVLQFISYVS